MGSRAGAAGGRDLADQAAAGGADAGERRPRPARLSEEAFSPVLLPEGQEHARDPDQALQAGRKRTFLVFTWFLVAEMLVNFDGGGTAAVLERFQKGCSSLLEPDHSTASPDMSFDPNYPCLTARDQGVLGSLPYIGLCLGAPVVGQLLQRFNEKHVILVGLSCNTAATLIFAYTLDRFLLFSAKFLVGLSHSGLVIYAPVWVDAFAPAASKTQWLGVTQASIAMGVMLGYAVTGYLVASGFHYQLAFKIQALLLCLACVVSAVTRDHHVNVSSLRAERGCDSMAPTQLRSRKTFTRVTACVFDIDDLPGSFTRTRSSSSFEAGRRHSVDSVSCRGGSPTSSSFSRQDSPGIQRTLSLDSAPGAQQGPSRSFSRGAGSTREPPLLEAPAVETRRELPRADSAQLVVVEEVTGEGALSSAHRGPLSTWGQVHLLLTNRIYCATCSGLCALFFVVTGVQYWTSKYFKISWQREDVEVTTVFIVVASTGPALGVALGAAIIDLLGGYDDRRGVRRTSLICTVWGALAMVAGLVAAVIPPVLPGEPGSGVSFYASVVCIWFQLLFGGAMLPPITGILIASVPEAYRTFASGLANVLYNIFGYALGAYLPGTIAESLCPDEAQEARMTMQIIFSWAIMAFVGILFTLFFLRRPDLHWGPSSEDLLELSCAASANSAQVEAS